MSATPNGDIVKEYLRKFPTVSSRKLAETIYAAIPGAFTDMESVRRMIRYYRGVHGVANRKRLSPDAYIPKINVPATDGETYTPFVLTEDDYPIIAGGDVHIPYHDQDALELFIERAVAIKAKTLIMAGDWLDCYQLSRWEKDPRNRSIKGEIEIFNNVLDTMQKALPHTNIIYKIGNHEERYDRYLMLNAPALYDLPSIRLPAVLGLDKRGIECVDDKRIIKAGKLHILHGHEYVYSISNPVNPARGLFNKAKKAAVVFHHHQTSEHTEPAIDGSIITCWSAGCLCDLHPKYNPLNKWNLGFIEITINDDGFYSIQNRKIINYQII